MTTSQKRSLSTQTREITWDEVDLYCKHIIEYIKNSSLDITTVAGIKRGGIIPGTIIAYKLGANFKAVRESYDIIKYNPFNTLLIDDVFDTGETLSKFTINRLNIAVLIGKPWAGQRIRNVIRPNFIAEIFSDWVVFPWEK